MKKLVVTTKELYCEVDACRGSNLLRKLSKRYIIFSGHLQWVFPLAVLPLASLGMVCWLVTDTQQCSLIFCTVLDCSQHPELSIPVVGRLQSVATLHVFAGVFDVWCSEQLLTRPCCQKSRAALKSIGICDKCYRCSFKVCNVLWTLLVLFHRYHICLVNIPIELTERDIQCL